MGRSGGSREALGLKRTEVSAAPQTQGGERPCSGVGVGGKTWRLEGTAHSIDSGRAEP